MYFSAEDLTQCVSETTMDRLPTVPEKSLPRVRNLPLELKKHWSDLDVKRSASESLQQISTIPLRSEWTSFKINAFVKSVNFVLVQEGGIERTEIANVTFDDLAFTAFQKEVMCDWNV